MKVRFVSQDQAIRDLASVTVWEMTYAQLDALDVLTSDALGLHRWYYLGRPIELVNEFTISSFTGQNAFLSNFHPSIIMVNGIYFPSVEHAYQAQKTEDPMLQRLIAEASTPGRAKRAGQNVVMRSDWEQIKFDVMGYCVMLKFAIPHLQRDLLATGDQTLIEGNTWGDRYWGQCNGVGQNKLGQILMSIRDYYKNAAST